MLALSLVNLAFTSSVLQGGVIDEGFNAFMTHKQLWQRIVEHGETMPITVENIKTLHVDFMRGVYDNAGFFSTKMRVMGQLDGVQTTDPEDIDEEMHRWVYKEAKAATLEAIAKAHAYFIHQFLREIPRPLGRGGIARRC